MNDQLTFLVVTFNKDFDMLHNLLSSIVTYFSNNYRLLVVLNDDKKHYDELKSILDQYPLSYRIDHDYEEVTRPVKENSYFGVRDTNGWATQQMLTLLAARRIDTPYYLHLCSKDEFLGPFELSDIINNDKTKAQVEVLEDIGFRDQFEVYYENACKIFNISPDANRNQLIRSITPQVNNTSSIRQFLDELEQQDIDIADMIGCNGRTSTGECKNKTTEYYSYSAWLVSKGILNNTVDFYKLDDSPFNMKVITYDLRRK